MLRLINVAAWLAAAGILLLAATRADRSDDSRTTVVHIEQATIDAAANDADEVIDALLPSQRRGSDPQIGPDEERTGTNARQEPAVALNDSGAVALSAARPLQAVDYLTRALAIDSTYARALYNLGLAYQSLNQLDDAVQAYSSSARHRPNYFEPAYNLGCLYADIDDHAKAIEWLTRSTEIVRGDRSAPAHQNLGNVYRRVGDISRAEASYREALRVRPGFVEPRFNLGLLLKSEDRYREAVEEFQKVAALGYRPAKLYRNLGICYSKIEELPNALAAYEQWATLDSTDGGAWYNLAITRARLGDTEGASEAYQRALAVDSSHYRAAFNMALLAAADGDPQLARLHYRRATAINPSYSRAFYNLALTFSREDRHDSAAVYYARVIELDPGNSRARFNLGLAYDKHGDAESAAREYAELVNREPTNYRALNNLGTAYLDTEKLDSALWCFNRLVTLSGKPEAYFNRAKAYSELDSLERAADDYRQAIRLRDQYGAAHHNLAIIEEKLGNLDTARQLLEETLEFGEQGWKRYWKLGQIYAQLGLTDKAREAYATAAKANPESQKFQHEYQAIMGTD